MSYGNPAQCSPLLTTIQEIFTTLLKLIELFMSLTHNFHNWRGNF
jgi:hypothetical protein